MTLKPWREVAIPHSDVAEGKYREAEFAADLSHVLQGRAVPEYQDPVEFYSRTYLTEGMKNLLKTTLLRVTEKGGEPVVKLKTSFGGGKTHTMLAIYHLFGKGDPSKLEGITQLMNETVIKEIPDSSIAVLVGTALDATKERKHPDLKDVTVRTLWGEMAVQLGGKRHGEEAFDLLRNADEKGVSPGSDTLAELFDRYGPCIILIDELVAYARNIYNKKGLPSGTFDSNMTFVQNLTEAVKKSKNSIVIASIPASDIEIGGEGGQAALERFENTFGRLESIWQPVGQIEGFEIVRRRLFNRIDDPAARDEVCNAFYRMYKEHSGDFPAKCKEMQYRERLVSAYPIHPELFDRLYEDWAAMEKFQRTRGVLRLMAMVINELWTSNDESLLIMPGSVPIYSSKVRSELIRYLGDPWPSVIDKDVDGKESEPSQVDKNTRFGAVQAARKVARTIFIGSAPGVKTQSIRGIEELRIRLGVAQPGANVSIYADALSRLRDRLTYLYYDNQRYWYDTRTNLIRTVDDRASQWDEEEVKIELKRRLQQSKKRFAFSRVHVAWEPEEIPDEQEARLVILSPDDVNRLNDTYPAREKATKILDTKGTGPRIYKNTLAFLAPDNGTIQNCLSEIRRYLAWDSILRDEDALNLDAAQKKQAKKNKDMSDNTVDLRINEAYCWLVVPSQEVDSEAGPKEINWEITKLTGSTEDGIVGRASKKIVNDQQLITEWSPVLLKMELDRLLWKDRDDISVRQLWEYFNTYLYLPRLANEEVLRETIKSGLSSTDFFAYASGKDEEKYLGLAWNDRHISISLDGTSLLVKKEKAQEQFEAEVAQVPEDVSGPVIEGEVAPVGLDRVPTPASLDDYKTAVPRRFYGSVEVDPVRMGKDAGVIGTEVIAHLTSLQGAKVKVSIEIQADVKDGVPENVVRTVSENSKTLKFKDFGFEEE